MKQRISKVVFAVASCGLVIHAALPMYAANALTMAEQASDIGDSSVQSSQAAAQEWRIASAADWNDLMNGAKSSDWSSGSYTGGDDVTIILEADIVTDRTSISLTQENITLTFDLNGHSFQSSAGIMNVNSTTDTGAKRKANSFVLCNGQIVNTCIDTSNAMKNVDIHGVDFTDMNTSAVQSSYSAGCTIHDCSFSHISGANTDTAIVASYSGSNGQPIQIDRVSIDGFQTGIDLSYTTGKSTVTDSTLRGTKAAGSRGIVCDYLMAANLTMFLSNVSNISQVKISDFDSGVCISVGELSLDNCEITNVNCGLDSRNGSARFNIRDSILTADPSVAGESFTGDSYGIRATGGGYVCLNTTVTGFKTGGFNNQMNSAIVNCTFDNLDCNVNAYSGVVYNSILKNADVGFNNNGVIGRTAVLVDTEVSGKNAPGSVGIYVPAASGELQTFDTAFFSPDNLHNSILNELLAYAESAYPEAPHYDMRISDYAAGLKCDGYEIQIGGIEVKNCETGISGTDYRGYTQMGVDKISDNYIHDCKIGVDCDSLSLNSNMYIYDCSQAGMQIHNTLTQPHLLEIYNCKDGLVFDGSQLYGPHLRIHDNTGNGLSYTGNTYASINATMEIYNNGGWNICGNDIGKFQLSSDPNNEFTCRLENGGLGNMNIKQSGSSGINYVLNACFLTSDESIYYVYPGKEFCITPPAHALWTDDTDWLQGSMVFDTENYTEGAVAAYVPPVYVRTESDKQEDTWDFVRTHFFAAKEGWVIRYDTSATQNLGGYPLVFTEGCSVTYDYETNGGTSIQSDYEKITYLEGEDVDLS
ncbi:MAG: hypothetical protein K2N24_05015, partial [Lachnospiraceae bacterium]|nr:hypothetical protein [Lachnospiraceae bacterium]